MRAVASLIAAAAALLFAQAAMADSALIYRIDSASAIVQHHRLVISANGAVNSGGWTRPELVIEQPSASEARIIKVRFVAKPPSAGEAVIQALLPIKVQRIALLPRYGAKKVEVIAATNAVTVAITR
jgi:hypothetical protein